MPILFFFLLLQFSTSILFQQKQDIKINESVNLELLDSIIFKPDLGKSLFDCPTHGFNVNKSKVKWNETLSTILLDNCKISHDNIYHLATKARPIFKPKEIKKGDRYTIITEKGPYNYLRQIILEPDPRFIVVFNTVDSLSVEKKEFPIEYVEKKIEVTITSSIYENILEKGGLPILVEKIVDILAWQVDFFRINEGDKFKVVYEEEIAKGVPIDINKIIGVYFEQGEDKYYGIGFENKRDIYDFFDENGKSLRKEFLKAPLNFKRISSRYTRRRFHPVQKRYKAHLGTDYAAPTGTPIRSVGDGIVVEARYAVYNGNYVKIRHNSTYTTQYLHMQKIKSGIRNGVKVKQGQIIGFVGSTGLATGPHLCFRFWKNGRQIDPFTVKIPPTESVSIFRRDDFEKVKSEVLQKLE